MLDNLQLLFVWAPILNVQVILEGIFVGAVFALSAYGLALVWGVMNIKNLAQGDFVIMGGYMALSLSHANVPLPPYSFNCCGHHVCLRLGDLCWNDPTHSRSRYVCFSFGNVWSFFAYATGNEPNIRSRSSDH